VDGQGLDFNAPILVEHATQRFELHAYIDSSGSMDDSSFSPPLSVQLEANIPPHIPYTPFFPTDERWVYWFYRSLSRSRRRVTLAFINESTPYLAGSGYYAYIGTGAFDEYGVEITEAVYIPGSMSPVLLGDLRTFGANFPGTQSYGHLYLVGTDQILRAGAIHAFQNELGGTGYNYEGIFYGSNISAVLSDSLSPPPQYYVKVYVLEPNVWTDLFFDLYGIILDKENPLVDFQRILREITTPPFNAIIEDSLFAKGVFEKYSDTEIEVEWTCGGRCPPGYCEISIPIPPYYCCIR